MNRRKQITLTLVLAEPKLPQHCHIWHNTKQPCQKRKELSVQDEQLQHQYDLASHVRQEARSKSALCRTLESVGLRDKYMREDSMSTLKPISKGVRSYLNIVGIVADALIGLIKSSVKDCTRAHIVQGRHTLFEPQQVFGGNHNQRLAEITMNLPSQTMEIVGGSCAVDNLPIGLLDLSPFVFSH